MLQTDKKLRYQDFYEIPIWQALLDGVLHIHKEGFIDEEGRVFNQIGFFLYEVVTSDSM